MVPRAWPEENSSRGIIFRRLASVPRWAERWGPRTLDADLLWIDGVVMDDPELTVPHPRWRQRRFVLAPLAELAPDLVGQAALDASGGEVAVVGTL